MWMPRLLRFVLTVAFVLLAGRFSIVHAADQQDFAWVSTQGTRFVDASGEPVVLKGCNVGNWFLLEMWMLAIEHGQFADQYEFEKNLADRFGEDEKDRLMDVYRANWVTPRDFEVMRSFGFNVIRLPFNYRLIEVKGEPGVLNVEGVKWLDRAVEMAEDAGMHVILDMHGVPGGQSVDHPTGRVEQNKLWDDPAYGTRTAQLWKQLAEHYKDRASIAGYDVINEPYADFQTDIRPRLREIFVEIYEAIREVDDRHVVFAPSALWGGHGFYGNPHENGWSNVAFTEHHYPGLFGDTPTLARHGEFTREGLAAKQEELDALQAPLFVGEWNPVFERLGGGDLMRHYFDRYAERGWAATMWSYKILHREGGVIDDNWYMVSNAEPLPGLDFETASNDEIEAYFRWFGEMDYVIDEPMRHALTRPDAVVMEFPEPEPPLVEAPHDDVVPGWTATDIGEPISGGQHVGDDGTLTVYGGGRDIWAEQDEFRLLWQDVEGDFVFEATLHGVKYTNAFAKAGLMARADLSPGAPHVLVHMFPERGVALGWREQAGASTNQVETPQGEWPVHLRLTRRGDTFRASYSTDGQRWEALGVPVTDAAVGRRCKVGLAVLSHDEHRLTVAEFSDVRLQGSEPPR